MAQYPKETELVFKVLAVDPEHKSMVLEAPDRSQIGVEYLLTPDQEETPPEVGDLFLVARLGSLTSAHVERITPGKPAGGLFFIYWNQEV
jgi:hypothetical protein